ncbi:hypothetical protein HC022_21120 [Salipiger sp. HF18]|uniref:hypothetical protein n=1 Tax=Salipiger sp. HF18 TaxID=2721557 RepID=UPI00142DFBED|nr:hypothetical protein [Salipiger sp. HF18]NIY98635.1 hypothetical protein [Salipiger sp. HF18]
MIDDTDGYFDDDQGMAQRLDGDQVLSGAIYAGGSDIVCEQSDTLRSPGGGDNDTLQFISVVRRA